MSDIKTKRKELDDRMKDLNKQIAHLQVEYQHLYLDCEHPNKKYYYDCRDGGGSDCPDCGKSW